MSSAQPSRLQHSFRALIEIGFIVFLFYSNLLMGEFTRSNGVSRTLAFALRDVATGKNLAIALTTAVVGHAVFEFLRRRVENAFAGSNEDR